MIMVVLDICFYAVVIALVAYDIKRNIKLNKKIESIEESIDLLKRSFRTFKSQYDVDSKSTAQSLYSVNSELIINSSIIKDIHNKVKNNQNEAKNSSNNKKMNNLSSNKKQVNKKLKTAK